MKRYEMMAIVGLLLMLVLSSLSQIHGEADRSKNALYNGLSYSPNRCRQQPLVVNGTTYTIDTDGTYSSITVTNGGTLKISDATITVENFIFANESSTIEITNAVITVGGGDLNSSGKYFIAEGCSKVTIMSSSITVEGTDSFGAFGQYGVYGGDGDPAIFKIEVNDYRLDVIESNIIVRGGVGGDGGDGMNNGGGQGGDGGNGGNGGVAIVIFNTSKGDVNIVNTNIECYGGDGGSGGDYGEGMDDAHNGQAGDGGHGGHAYVYLHSITGVVLHNSVVMAKGGNGGRGGLGYDYGGDGGDWGTGNIELYGEGQNSYGYSISIDKSSISGIKGRCGQGGVASAPDGVNGEDGNNNGQEPDKSSLTIIMKSIEDIYDSVFQTSEFKFRNIGVSDIIISLYNTTLPNSTIARFYFDGEIEIDVMRTLTVHVMTVSGLDLAGVDINIENADDPSISKFGQTDSNGVISLEAPGRRIYLYGPSVKDKTQAYNVDITYRSETRQIQVHLDKDKTLEVEMPDIHVEITRIEIVGISEVSPGSTVGSTVIIYGNTTTPYTDKGIQTVYIGIKPVGSTVMPNWQPGTNDDGSWGSWHFEWDTTSGYEDGIEYNITAWATDDYLDDFYTITLTVDQNIINHKPEITLESPANNTEIKVYSTGAMRYITFRGIVSDEDYHKSEGVIGSKITRIEARLLDADRNPLPERGNWFTITSDYSLLLNWSQDTGQGEWSFRIDAITVLGEEGTYWLDIRAYDGKYYSDIVVVKFSISIISAPKLKIKSDDTYIGMYDTINLDYDPEGGKDPVVVLDLSESTSGMPGNSPKLHILYVYVDYGDGVSDNLTLDKSINATLVHEYKPKPKNKYEDEKIRYNITIYIENAEGLQSDKITFDVQIHYKGLKPPAGGLFEGVIPEDAKESTMNSLVAMVIILNVIGPLTIIFKSTSEKKKMAIEIESIDAKIKAESERSKEAKESIYAMEMGLVREREAVVETVSYEPSYMATSAKVESIYETPMPKEDVTYETPTVDKGAAYESTTRTEAYMAITPRPSPQPSPQQQPQIQVQQPRQRESLYSQSVYTAPAEPKRATDAVYQTPQPSVRPTISVMPRTSNRCPKCGVPVQPNWVICPKCFTQLKQ